MALRIFCKIDNIVFGDDAMTINITYNGDRFSFLKKSLIKLITDKRKKLIEISTYPSDKWEAAFKFWHKCIDMICNELSAKKINVIYDTIPLTKLNFKEYLKAEFGRHKILYKKDGKVIIQNASSTTYTFDELMDIINNTLQYARDNQLDIDKFIDEYKEIRDDKL